MTRCNINQGDCVKILNEKDLFQVIGIDNSHEKCWIRRFPLLSNGSPVFEIPTSEIIKN
ncbi:hypothetical protein [Prochlorococcus sp. MIT 1223]|uniref:hypothetical protein n=1 Tax=Prochlorococcus sp. MIT 1223 TaxID=3096217 RepID=UPI002A74F3AC|nr:hypothetical protein [Prochlorococcus sp. MIT 1223]